MFLHFLIKLEDTSVANLILSAAQSFSNSACSLSACCFKEASAPARMWLMVDDGWWWLMVGIFVCASLESWTLQSICQHDKNRGSLLWNLDVEKIVFKIVSRFIKILLRTQMSQDFSMGISPSFGFPKKRLGPPDHLRLSAVARLVGRIGLVASKGSSPTSSDLLRSFVTFLG